MPNTALIENWTNAKLTVKLSTPHVNMILFWIWYPLVRWNQPRTQGIFPPLWDVSENGPGIGWSILKSYWPVQRIIRFDLDNLFINMRKMNFSYLYILLQYWDKVLG